MIYKYLDTDCSNGKLQNTKFWLGLSSPSKRQEASWGGAGVKILLSVKYQRDPQGDEPGTEPC